MSQETLPASYVSFFSHEKKSELYVGSGFSGWVRVWRVLFVLGAQKYNQNNLATLPKSSDVT